MANPINSLYVHPGTMYVGIGTQQPQEKLTVAGNICPATTLAYDLGTSNLRFRDLYLSGSSINLGGTVLSRDGGTGGLRVLDGTAGGAGGAPLDMTVRNLIASNVSVIGDYVTLNTVTSNTEQMVITNAGTGPGLKVTQTGNESIAEFYDDGGVLALKIADGGNVGIGTAAPTAKLEVNGFINIKVPACHVRSSSAQTIAAWDNSTKVDYNVTPTINRYNLFNVTTKRIEPPVYGLYYIYACYSISRTTENKYQYISITKNATATAVSDTFSDGKRLGFGGISHHAPSSGNVYPSVQATAIAELTTSDYVEIYGSGNGASAKYTSSDSANFIMAYLITCL